MRSQLDPCCQVVATGLTTIGSTLNTVVGGALKDISSIEQTISNFEQKVVWPAALINQARALVASVQGLFTQIEGIMRVPVNSATLPATQQFEQNLLSRDPNQILQMSAQYSAVYGALPAVVGASPQVRDMTDMTDAAAQAAMKRAIQNCRQRTSFTRTSRRPLLGARRLSRRKPMRGSFAPTRTRNPQRPT